MSLQAMDKDDMPFAVGITMKWYEFRQGPFSAANAVNDTLEQVGESDTQRAGQLDQYFR